MASHWRLTTKKKLLRCKPNSLSQAKQQRPAASRASRSWRPRFAEAHRQARCCAEPGGIMFPGIGGRILVGSLSPAPRAGPLAQPCTASWDSFPSALQASLASGRRPCRASSWVLLHRLKSYAGSEADTKHSSAKTAHSEPSFAHHPHPQHLGIRCQVATPRVAGIPALGRRSSPWVPLCLGSEPFHASMCQQAARRLGSSEAVEARTSMPRSP